MDLPRSLGGLTELVITYSQGVCLPQLTALLRGYIEACNLDVQVM